MNDDRKKYDWNRWEFAGNLGSDPQARTTPSGKRVADANVAVATRTGTMWVRVTAWDDGADYLCATFRKGSRIEVVGPMSVREFDRNDGTKGQSIEVTAWEMNEGQRRDGPRDGTAVEGRRPPSQHGSLGPPQVPVEERDFEIPF